MLFVSPPLSIGDAPNLSGLHTKHRCQPCGVAEFTSLVEVANEMDIVFCQLCNATVARLMARERPADIARFIITVPIWPAIYRMLRRRLWPKVSGISDEASSPAFAYANATSPVGVVIMASWIVAAAYHSPPSIIQRVRLVTTLFVAKTAAFNAVFVSIAQTIMAMSARLASVKSKSASNCLLTFKIWFSHWASYTGQWLGLRGVATSRGPLELYYECIHVQLAI